MHDRTDNGGSLKMLTLIDEFSRQCLKIEVGRKLKSKDVLDALAEVVEVTRTGPIEKLVWAPTKDPENER